MIRDVLNFLEFCEGLEDGFELVLFEVEGQLTNIYFNKLNRSAKQ